MLEFNYLSDLKIASVELHNYLKATIHDSEYKDSFEWLFGGKFYVIESLPELSEIKGVNGASLLEAVDQYDVAEYTEAENFAIFALMTNNSGGNTYAIPKYIADQCANVEAAIQYHAGE